jgi:DNA-directed RNA polymerase specialized sigma24 family protein
MPGTCQGEDQPPLSPGGAQDDLQDIEWSLRDPDRFGVIFDRYFTEIHGYIARRLGDDAADDIAAEAFLTAFRERKRFDPGRGIVRAWLYGIVTNHMNRYRRREVRAYRAMGRTEAPGPDASHADLVADRVTAAGTRRTGCWPPCPAFRASAR